MRAVGRCRQGWAGVRAAYGAILASGCGTTRAQGGQGSEGAGRSRSLISGRESALLIALAVCSKRCGVAERGKSKKMALQVKMAPPSAPRSRTCNARRRQKHSLELGEPARMPLRRQLLALQRVLLPSSRVWAGGLRLPPRTERRHLPPGGAAASGAARVGPPNGPRAAR